MAIYTKMGDKARRDCLTVLALPKTRNGSTPMAPLMS